MIEACDQALSWQLLDDPHVTGRARFSHYRCASVLCPHPLPLSRLPSTAGGRGEWKAGHFTPETARSGPCHRNVSAKESVHQQTAAERTEPLSGGLQVFPLPHFHPRGGTCNRSV